MLPGSDIYRSVFITPSTTTGQILFGSTSVVTLLQFDAVNSTIATGRLWEQFDVTPAGLAPASDTVVVPSAGRVEIPPVWWFADQDDVVVGSRADVGTDVPYAWDRNPVNAFAPIPPSPAPGGGTPTPVPTGAVGGGILNRILVLLGCTSFSEPDPLRYMTIRWSDRYDFGQWTPSDLTVSGELQLEGGSRIVGGGVVGFGVVAWTDKRMALLTETFDPDSVFSRRYIDGGRGLLANQAWCEADGQVWWLDENRTLNVFDGGRPRQIINTNKLSSVERIEDPQAARIYMTPNPEYGEIVISYPRNTNDEPNAQLVYNYLHNCWYPWSLDRTGWASRVGVIRSTAVDQNGAVWGHDLDVGLIAPWALGPSPSAPDPGDVEPYDWELETNLVTQPNPGLSSWESVKITLDQLYAPALGVVDTYDVTVTGYREPRLGQDTEAETHEFGSDVVMKDYRIGGKAIQVSMDGTNQKTVWRFGQIEISGAIGGER
jgi:hypothetical protein